VFQSPRSDWLFEADEWEFRTRRKNCCFRPLNASPNQTIRKTVSQIAQFAVFGQWVLRKRNSANPNNKGLSNFQVSKIVGRREMAGEHTALDDFLEKNFAPGCPFLANEILF
jgi:hypothetical protein